MCVHINPEWDTRTMTFSVDAPARLVGSTGTRIRIDADPDTFEHQERHRLRKWQLCRVPILLYEKKYFFLFFNPFFEFLSYLSASLTILPFICVCD